MALCASQPSLAQTAAPVEVNIAAQPLAQALNELARQARLQVLVAPELVAGKTAPAVTGSLTPAQALTRLLVGSGLEGVAQGTSIVVRRIAAPAAAAEASLPEIRVRASTEPLPGDPPKSYAGGQVARGSGVGILGDKDIFETPFNVTSYTAQAMADQQVTRIADIIKRDASVQSAYRQAGYDQGFLIRGLRVTASATTFDGGPGIYAQYGGNSAIGIERVEVFKGANTLLGGLGAGGLAIGGSINLVPKRATDAPVTQLTTSFSSKSQFSTGVDLGRRFGADNDFGIRVNVFAQDGNTAIEDARERRHVETLAFDYRGERARLFIDIGEDVYKQRGVPGGFYVVDGVNTPAPPRLGSNFTQPWNFADIPLRYGVIRGEFDFTPSITLRASYGGSESRYRALYSYGAIVDNDANLDEIFQYFRAIESRRDAAVSLTSKFTTGPVNHQLVIGWLKNSNKNDQLGYYDEASGGLPTLRSNLYNPVRVPQPNISFPSEADITGPNDQGFQNANSSVAVADTVSAFDDRLQLTLGLRKQRVSYGSRGGGFYTEQYNEATTTPAIALLYKFNQQVSFYGNYIESLEPGPTAPDDPQVINRGQVFPPTRDKQYELGVKVDFGRFGITADAFQITQAFGLTNPSTRIYSIGGKQRNRGLEFNVFGEVDKTVRLTGGLMLLDPRYTNTEDGLLDGKQATGVALANLSLFGEWDLPFAPGFKLTGGLLRSGSTYTDAANTRKKPGQTYVDLGLGYRTKLAGKALALNANVSNLLRNDSDYNAPRTLQLSATVDF